MRKDTSGGSKNLKPKIFGATPLQVGEDDVSRLIGGIVEKGFSQVPQTRPLAPPSAPRPTVLPFPAARHRSHGPHWAPKVGNLNLHNDDDNDNEDDHTGEEGDFDGMETAADVANPVQRKEKKGLDFSRWREIVEKDAKPAYHEKEKGGYSNGMEVGQKDKKMAANGLRRPIADRVGAKLQSVTMVDNASKIKEVKEETRDTSVLASAKEFHSFKHGKNENGVQTKQYQQDGIGESEGSTVVEEPSTRENEVRKEMDLKMQNMQKSYAASGFSAQKLGGGEKDSLQSEIDSENRARLADMSVDDIAEAQAEIMAKMNPELINALKKRGQAKAKRQKSSLTDVSGSASNGMGGEEALSKSSENTVSSPNVSPDKGGIWNAWSKRVERVRDMRFSIDGDIIGFGLESDIGLYDSNNVSRRDYLRTEGDPGAAGYTIKEAIALARSVVPGQRTLALSVISSILNRAIYSITQNQVDVESADWVAIWAYALGPEPELALSLRLPSFYSHMHDRIEDATQDTETWSWGHFGPIIDLALEWIQVKNIPYVSRLFNSQRNDGESLSLQDSEVNSLLWVISSVLSMLATVLESVIPGDIMSLPNGQLPWLPDFVPKTGLEIINNGYFRFAGLSDTNRNTQPSENGSLVEYLCRLRLKEKPEFC